jgi:enterochelin esterase-like enzyme
METFAEFRKKLNLAKDLKKKRLLVDNYVKSRLSRGAYPITEGESVTFLFNGKVENKVALVGDMNDWNQEADKLQKIEDTDLYYKTMRFPRDARVEYAFIKDGQWTHDLLNREHSFEGYFGYMSELQMPNYRSSVEIDYDPKIPHGKILTFRMYSKLLRNTRLVHVYLPPNYSPPNRYPTIYAQDGTDYLRYGFFDNVLDNLINGGLVYEAIGVFIEPVYRVTEYDLNNRYVDFFAKELVPHIDANYSTMHDPSRRLVMGPSFGGLISVYTAFMHPELFRYAASQSGYVSRKDDWVIKEIEKSRKKKIKFYFDCGTYENNVGGGFGSFTEGNRSICEALKKKGYEFVYHEFNEGHNWENWRARIGTILKMFLGTKKTEK